MPKFIWKTSPLFLSLVLAGPVFPPGDSGQGLKLQVVRDVEAMTKQSQVMIDTVFSFAELGFQEFETSKYLTRCCRGIIGWQSLFRA